MMMRTYVIAAEPLRLVTNDPDGGLFARTPWWVWLAIAIGLLLAVALALVLTLGRDRSHRAEAGRAFARLARTSGVPATDRVLLERGAREAAIEPVACLLSVGAFDRVLHSAPAEFRERFGLMRARVFPEAGPPAQA